MQWRWWCINDSDPEIVSCPVLHVKIIFNSWKCHLTFVIVLKIHLMAIRITDNYEVEFQFILKLDCSRARHAPEKLPVLTLFTKDACPLCDEAKAVLINSSLWNRFVWQEVDIRRPENRKWFGMYRYEIPVFHLNGKFFMKHHVDFKLLEDELNAAEL